MQIKKTIQSRIFNLCNQHHITPTELARRAKLSRYLLKNLLYSSSGNTKIATVKAVCDAFGITMAEFFDSPEFEALGLKTN